MDISIIIVSYNTKKLLRDCIISIIKNTKNINYEIIVVDNASTDGSVEVIKKLRRTNSINLKIIENETNLGFGGGNNLGIKRAKGKFILLLNSDTIIHDNLVREMVSWMDDMDKVGVASCGLKNSDGSFQGTGGSFPDLLRVFSWMFFIEDIPGIDRLIKPFHPMHPNSPVYKGDAYFKKEHETDWLTAAFLLIRKKVIEEVGYFDENYFAYVEEVDLCYRVKKGGWKVYYNPSWSITHYGGASSTAEFPILSEFEGVKIFYKKHMPKWQYPVLRVMLKAGALIRIGVLGLLKGKPAVKTYVKAFQIA